MASEPDTVLREKSLGAVRMIVGALMVYHGQEVFHPDIMNNYFTWDTFQFPGARAMIYAGKLSELTGGVLLVLGLYTRVGVVLIAGTMLYITFFVGHGRFWYEDQHPFLFVLLSVLFFFMGPGAWSLDGRSKG